MLEGSLRTFLRWGKTFWDLLLGIFSIYLPLFCKTYYIASRPPVRDYRTRRNRAQRRADAFGLQLPSLVRAYMDWMLQMGDTGLAGNYSLPPNADIQGESQLKVVDILST